MFTGIVEEVGEVTRIEQRGENRRITIAARETPRQLGTGHSVAVSGVCVEYSHGRGRAVFVVEGGWWAKDSRRVDRCAIAAEAVSEPAVGALELDHFDGLS